MNKILKKKKGELTTQQIVSLIILITSFAVILFFFFRLNLGEETQKEICHNSVVLKGKTSFGGNLDCRTNYVCISGGEKCEKINPTQTIKIDLSKDNVKNEIMKAIADEMVDCWWQFGEGKIDYVGGFDVGDKQCAICSKVAFDKSLINSKISYEDLYIYLKEKNKDSSQKYLNYLYGINDINKFTQDFLNLNEEINFEEKYLIVTGIAKKDIIGWFFSAFTFEDPKKPLHPRIIKNSDISNLKCGEFITKA